MAQETKRIESDSMGMMEVPANCYYGAQTARSLIHFNIGHDKMPEALIHAFGILKACAAQTNCELGKLPEEKAKWIIQAAEEVASGQWQDQFPLSIWQTGSGTQTNMNVNEVIANRALELSGHKMGTKDFIHPNDHVNMSQSSNDTFPTAMHIASAEQIHYRLIPMLKKLREAIAVKKSEFWEITKIGRTHLMDATPITLGQEFSGYLEQIDQDIERIQESTKRLYELAIGGTAVGTGLLAPADFGIIVSGKIAEKLGLPFLCASNKFAALASHDPMVFASSALKTLACTLIKIATDISLMGSGPRCGLNELIFPENEPGSSIMPGKINPTQCEALIMVCTQVFGNDAAIAMAGARGNFELNVFKPLIIHNFLHSLTLLSDVCRTFVDYFLQGLTPNLKQIDRHLNRSLMLVTSLSPKLGYDKAAKIALKAYHEDLTLKQAADELGYLSEKEFDDLVKPKEMTNLDRSTL